MHQPERKIWIWVKFLRETDLFFVWNFNVESCVCVCVCVWGAMKITESGILEEENGLFSLNVFSNK